MGDGIALGCVGATRAEAFLAKMDKLKTTRSTLAERSVSPKVARDHGLTLNQDGVKRSALDLLSYPDIQFHSLLGIWPELAETEGKIAEQIKRDALYSNYIDRQRAEVEALHRDEAHEIPEDFDYMVVDSLSNELKAKLTQIRPRTLGQAGRIEGMTPAALTLILARMKQRKRTRQA